MRYPYSLKVSILSAFALVTLPVAAEEAIKSRALELVNKLQKEGIVENSYYAIAKDRLPFVDEEISGRSGQWHEHYFKDQQDFVVTGVKQEGNFAGVLVFSRDRGKPFGGRIHRICLLKQEDTWAIAPMISNFTYSNRKLDTETDDAIKSINQWFDWESAKNLKKFVEVDRLKFQEKIDRKREELRANCKNSQDLVEYFIQQARLGSREGVCAAVGYNTSEDHAEEDESLVLESIILGLDKTPVKKKGSYSRSQIRGGWGVITEKSAVNAVVKVIPSANGEPDRVIFGFASPSFRNSYQLASFYCEFGPESHKINLPNELLLRRSTTNARFFANGFERWNADQTLQELWDKAPAAILRQCQGNYGKTIKDHLASLSKARSAGDFATWLGGHVPLKALEDDEARAYLKRIIADFKEPAYRTKANARPYTYVGMKMNKGGTRAVSLSVAFDFSSPRSSRAKYDYFKKHEAGWGVVSDADGNEMKELKKQFGGDRINVVNRLVADIEKRIVKVDTTALVTGELDDNEVSKVAQSYLDAIKEVDFFGVSSMGCDVRKDNAKLIEKFGMGMENLIAAKQLRLKKVVCSPLGIATILVEAKWQRINKHMVFYVVNTPEGLKVDVCHRVEEGNQKAVAKRLKKITLDGFEDVYSEPVVEFLKKAHEEMEQSIR